MDYVISSGVTSVGLVLGSGDTLAVSDGGVASATIDDNGTETALSGGSIIGSVLSGYTTQIVLAGGSASFTTLDNGSEAHDFGTETSASIGVNATLVVAAGGVASATFDDNGELLVSGGSAFATTILDGFENVVSGSDTGATILVSGLQLVQGSGVAIGAMVSSGGYQRAQSSGVVSTTTVSSGGTLNVFAGGSAVDATALSGGRVYVSAGSVSDTTLSGGLQTIVAAGSAFATQISAGGQEITSSGGVSLDATVTSGGTESVWAGGSAVMATVGHGGNLLISSGGVASGSIAVGEVVVSAGGQSFGTELVPGAPTDDDQSPGGVERVMGSATGTIIGVDGLQIVSSGGVATSSVVTRGGYLGVSFGGSVMGAIVSSGGNMQVASGALVSDTVLSPVDAGIQIAVNGNVGSVFGYAIADELTVSGSAYDAADTVTLDADNLLVITQADGGRETLQFDPAQDFSGDMFSVVADPNNLSVLDIVGSAACFCAGTRMLTDAGYRRVEDLAPGDLVATVDGACEPIVWIGRRSYSARALAGRRHRQPVRVRRGALADNVPTRDLLVSPLHALLLDEVLIPAWLLINGHSIVQEEHASEVRYFHIELATHAALLADGAAVESFAEDNNRAMFDNAADAPQESRLQLPTDMISFAPRVIDGAALEIVRRRLSTRVASQPAAA